AKYFFDGIAVAEDLLALGGAERVKFKIADEHRIPHGCMGRHVNAHHALQPFSRTFPTPQSRAHLIEHPTRNDGHDGVEQFLLRLKMHIHCRGTEFCLLGDVARARSMKSRLRETVDGGEQNAPNRWALDPAVENVGEIPDHGPRMDRRFGSQSLDYR